MSSKKTGEFFKKLLPGLFLSAAMAFMLGIYEPVVLYFHNKNEFWYDLYLLLPVTLLMFLGIFLLSAVAFAVCCLLSGEWETVPYCCCGLYDIVSCYLRAGKLLGGTSAPAGWNACCMGCL